MASIGGISIIGFSGPIQLSGRTSRMHSRPGTDSWDLHDTGIRGGTFATYTEADYTTLANMTAAKKAMMALKGTSVTVVDNLGNTWNNIFVNDMYTVSEKLLGVSSGGLSSGQYFLTMAAQLTNLSTSF